MYNLLLRKIYLFYPFVLFSFSAFCNIESGTGISDITGPPAEVVMMGYANPKQVTAGIHTRLFARAFIFASNETQKRIVFVSSDLVHMYSSIKQGVISALKLQFGNLYDDSNVMLAATHTHAGPGGFSHHTLYNITSYGFNIQNYQIIVNGIVDAIKQAHQNLSESKLSFSSNDLSVIGNINRSLIAFKMNREIEANLKPNPEDPNMSILRIDGNRGPRGTIAWFAVHATSLSRDNKLISSDNKGYASFEFEKQFGSIPPFLNSGNFVAAFPNGAEGDLSPNTRPGFQRPGMNDFDSVKISGQLQFESALKQFNDTTNKIDGPIDFRHTYIHMPSFKGKDFHLCSAALGFSFAAGAEDGPSGMPFFKEGMTQYNLNLSTSGILISTFIKNFIPQTYEFSNELNAEISFNSCQSPKPILLPTGNLYWTPEILPFQILRLGSLAILGIPGEMTLQAGRRLTAQVLKILQPIGIQKVIITGLANEYSSYISTPEEYSSQQYEGASTLFGPHTFSAYELIFEELALAMVKGKTLPAGTRPPNLSSKQWNFHKRVLFDNKKSNEEMGEVLIEPEPKVKVGEVVTTTFRSGHPNNDLKTNDSYFTIEKQVNNNEWKIIAWDNMPETQLHWKYENFLECFSCSQITIKWNIPLDASPGIYRIKYKGAWRKLFESNPIFYEGQTQEFLISSQF